MKPYQDKQVEEAAELVALEHELLQVIKDGLQIAIRPNLLEDRPILNRPADKKES